MRIYNPSIDAYLDDFNNLTIFLNDFNKEFKINLNDLLPFNPISLGKIEIDDSLLIQVDKNNERYVVYVLNEIGYICYENNLTECVNSDIGFNFNIENFTEMLTVKKIGVSSLGLFKNNNLIHVIDGVLKENNFEEVFDLRNDFTIEEFYELSELNNIAKVEYGNSYLFVYFDKGALGIKFKRVNIDIVYLHPKFSIEMSIINHLEVNYDSNIEEAKLSSITLKSPKKLFDFDDVSKIKNENILGLILINKTKFFIFQKSNGIYLGKNNGYRATGYKPFLKLVRFKDNLYFIGRHTHYAYNAFDKYNKLYLHTVEHEVSTFKRFFPKLPLLKRYGYFKVKLDDLRINDRIHNNFFIGNDQFIVHNFKMRYQDKLVKTRVLKAKKYLDLVQVIRTNLHGNLTSTMIPYSDEYSLLNRFKIRIAEWLGKFSKKDVNLYFEKKSMKADESSYRVFSEVMKRDSKKKNYFVISKESDHYLKLKETYGDNIVEKYSFKHFLSIFKANYFISSELPNHLVNDRLYIDNLRNKLMEVPAIFLQHGIMFAKPVDNPMALGFHKSNNAYNIKKNVISSELEATQFYKMGYDEDDLLLTGLATFDFAYLDEGADKIAYMPTYRYWEEGLIYKNEIENTSYYKSIMKVIRAFEKEGLLDRLLIVPHNKFSQFIYDNMPEYKHIISDNPSEALKISRIFITDYSSAIYDATFRGAYPIFYWEEKDYLIENYKAIPPVNEENAPGVIAYSIEELVKYVKNAIENNYVISDEIKEKYLAINSFTDRKNTIRIVDYLEDSDII